SRSRNAPSAASAYAISPAYGSAAYRERYGSGGSYGSCGSYRCTHSSQGFGTRDSGFVADPGLGGRRAAVQAGAGPSPPSAGARGGAVGGGRGGPGGRRGGGREP